jgi:hypothetical protein
MSVSSALKLIRASNPRLAAIPTDRGVKAGDGRLAATLKRLGTGIDFKLDYLDKEGLPGKLRGLDPILGALSRAGLLGHHKYLPYRRWFRDELRPLLIDALRRDEAADLPWLNAEALGNIDSSHFTGRINGLSRINAVLTLEAVNRLLVRGEGFGTIGKAETHGPDGT